MDKKKPLKEPLREVADLEDRAESMEELKEAPQKSEAPEKNDSTIQREMREKIEAMGLDDGLISQVQPQADGVESLDGQKKIKKLLEIAKAKGVVFAVHVAKKMNDPYLLDSLHDSLADGGYYKNLKI